MQGKCRMKNVLYKCIVSTQKKTPVYKKMNGKEWYYNRTTLFRNKHIKMKRHLVVRFGKLKKILGKYQH